MQENYAGEAMKKRAAVKQAKGLGPGLKEWIIDYSDYAAQQPCCVCHASPNGTQRMSIVEPKGAESLGFEPGKHLWIFANTCRSCDQDPNVVEKVNNAIRNGAGLRVAVKL